MRDGPPVLNLPLASHRRTWARYIAATVSGASTTCAVYTWSPGGPQTWLVATLERFVLVVGRRCPKFTE